MSAINMERGKEFNKVIIFPSRIGEIAKVMDELRTYFNKKNYHDAKYQRFLDAIYEAVSNAIIHGNGKDEAKKISINLHDSSDRVQVKVTDKGKGFDTFCIADPCLPDNITKPHGRGLHIIKNSVDGVSFDENGSEITMVINK
jgi:anti-sigma regulatory factor (Ser/Thr protein kinase)